MLFPISHNQLQITKRFYIAIFLFFALTVIFPATSAFAVTCTTSADCGAFGTCQNGQCEALPGEQEAFGEEQPEDELFKAGLRGAEGILGKAAGTAGFPTITATSREPEVIVGKLIQSAILLIGVVFGILVIYGGYLWMTARGNEDQAKKAIDILKTTVVGFILVIAAYAITNFVVDRIITAAFTP